MIHTLESDIPNTSLISVQVVFWAVCSYGRQRWLCEHVVVLKFHWCASLCGLCCWRELSGDGPWGRKRTAENRLLMARCCVCPSLWFFQLCSVLPELQTVCLCNSECCLIEAGFFSNWQMQSFFPLPPLYTSIPFLYLRLCWDIYCKHHTLLLNWNQQRFFSTLWIVILQKTWLTVYTPDFFNLFF